MSLTTPVKPSPSVPASAASAHRGKGPCRTRPAGKSRRPAFTLMEIVLVAGLLVLITSLIAPRLAHLLEREELPGSAKQLRSFITLVRAHAAWEGKRYRIRFPDDREKDPLGGTRQPIIEREDEPLERPEEFTLVTEPWAIGVTLLGEVWVAEVRLGRPTIAGLQRLREFRSEVRDTLTREFDNVEHFEVERPPLIVEADGTSDWVVFVLTKAPHGTAVEDLEDHERIELIVDGMTGLAWMQRPFFEEELDLFEEKGWPAVLRQDFLSRRPLTENDVLELHEFRIQGQDGDKHEQDDLPSGFESHRSEASHATP